MATQQKSTWYQKLLSKPIMAAVVIGIFSIGGAIYLQGSHALTSPTQVQTVGISSMTLMASKGLNLPSVVTEGVDTTNVAHYQSVIQLPASATPGQSTSWCNNPYTTPKDYVTICPTNTTVLVDSGSFKPNTCYKLTAVAGAAGGITGIIYEWVTTDCSKPPFDSAFTTSVQTIFSVNPTRRDSFMACALIRRDQAAPLENVQISITQVNQVTSLPLTTSIRQVAGSAAYDTICSTSRPTEPWATTMNFVVKVSNKAAAHVLRIGRISFIELGY